MSFLNLDAVVSPDYHSPVAKDGVHLNAEGAARVGKSILQRVGEMP